jgi:hypothetical protein
LDHQRQILHKKIIEEASRIAMKRVLNRAASYEEERGQAMLQVGWAIRRDDGAIASKALISLLDFCDFISVSKTRPQGGRCVNVTKPQELAAAVDALMVTSIEEAVSDLKAKPVRSGRLNKQLRKMNKWFKYWIPFRKRLVVDAIRSYE